MPGRFLSSALVLFTSHSKSVRQHRHLCGHASHKRYTVSKLKGQEINFQKSLPHKGSNLGPWCTVTGVHATTALLLMQWCSNASVVTLHELMIRQYSITQDLCMSSYVQMKKYASLKLHIQ